MNKILLGLSFFLILSQLISCTISDRRENEIYVLPNGFTGVAYVIYDVNNGVEKAFEDGVRVYNIPANGLLFTQFSRQSGNKINDKFFYFDGENMREIPLDGFEQTVESKDSSQIFARFYQRHTCYISCAGAAKKIVGDILIVGKTSDKFVERGFVKDVKVIAEKHKSQLCDK